MGTIRFVDLFCGIGGFRLGLEKASPKFKTVWSNDNDRYACRIYRKHWGNGELHEGDIQAVDADGIPEHTLLCAGFPCQSFSFAGKRRGFEDTRGTLFFEICRILQIKKPPTIILENVRGLLSHHRGTTAFIILQSLDELGYDCQWQVLNSKDFGIPQNRERLFIVGHLRGKAEPQIFPIGNGEANGNKALLLSEGEELSLPTLPALYHKRRLQGSYLEEAGRFRLLTPLEYERAQGFPDGWTEGISDTQRYKCLGNAVTVNVVEAIGGQLLSELQDG